jgi:hypothetical protein
MGWSGHVARMGELKNAYKRLIGNRKEKTALGRLRHRWEDNIKMNFVGLWTAFM